MININVSICDRPYRLKIRPEEEEQVRKAAKDITDKVKDLQEQFAGKDKQDYLAMHALTLAVSGQQEETRQRAVESTMAEDLQAIDEQLEKLVHPQG